MAALLASVCSVPLTSVLLLFELTKDYHILLPLMVRSLLCLYSKLGSFLIHVIMEGILVALSQFRSS